MKKINKTVLFPCSSLQNKSVKNWKKYIPIIDYDKCIGCGRCVLFCPEMAVYKSNKEKLKNNLPKPAISLDYCKGCGLCEKVCPVNAIKMIKIKS